MPLAQQIFWGSVFLGICVLMHVAFLAGSVPWTEAVAHFFKRRFAHVRNAAMMLCSMSFMVVSHTIQVWFWAAFVLRWGPLETWNEAIYFLLITYTSLGYGDIVLGEGLRVFAAFAAVTGLLAFGLSTAFLVALMTRILRDTFATGDHAATVPLDRKK